MTRILLILVVMIEAGSAVLLARQAASLDALSPLAVLQRGYAIAEHEDGRLLRDANSVSFDERLLVRLAKGRIVARVEEIKTNDE